MTREAYHNALKKLQDEVLLMGEMVSNAIRKSVEALQKRDIGHHGNIYQGFYQWFIAHQNVYLGNPLCVVAHAFEIRHNA